MLACGVLALLFARAEGKRFHLPFGDGTAIAAAGIWAGALIVARLFDRPLGQNLLALACAAILFLAGARERAKRPADDLPPEHETPPIRKRRPPRRPGARRQRPPPSRSRRPSSSPTSRSPASSCVSVRTARETRQRDADHGAGDLERRRHHHRLRGAEARGDHAGQRRAERRRTRP